MVEQAGEQAGEMEEAQSPSGAAPSNAHLAEMQAKFEALEVEMLKVSSPSCCENFDDEN